MTGKIDDPKEIFARRERVWPDRRGSIGAVERLVALSREVRFRLEYHFASGRRLAIARAGFSPSALLAQQSVDGFGRGAVVRQHANHSRARIFWCRNADWFNQTAVRLGPAAPPR